MQVVVAEGVRDTTPGEALENVASPHLQGDGLAIRRRQPGLEVPGLLRVVHHLHTRRHGKSVQTTQPLGDALQVRLDRNVCRLPRRPVDVARDEQTKVRLAGAHRWRESGSRHRLQRRALAAPIDAEARSVRMPEAHEPRCAASIEAPGAVAQSAGDRRQRAAGERARRRAFVQQRT